MLDNVLYIVVIINLDFMFFTIALLYINMKDALKYLEPNTNFKKCSRILMLKTIAVFYQKPVT